MSVRDHFHKYISCLTFFAVDLIFLLADQRLIT